MEKIKISDVKTNHKNPRVIKDDKYKKLDPTLTIKKNGEVYKEEERDDALDNLK